MKRIITGVLIALPAAGGILLGGWAFTAWLVILAMLMAVEWEKLWRESAARARGIGLGLSVTALLVLAQLEGIVSAMAALLVLSVLTACGQIFSEKRAVLAGGLLYIGLPCLAAFWFRTAYPDGMWLIFYIVFVVVGVDISALIAGKTIGGPRLVSRVSPGKTWAGLIGGGVGATLVSLVFYGVMRMNGVIYPFVSFLIWPIVLTLIAQAGDLLESVIKRKLGVKDSGAILPGHGGILDRVDGLTAVLIFMGGVALLRDADQEITPSVFWGQ